MVVLITGCTARRPVFTHRISSVTNVPSARVFYPTVSITKFAKISPSTTMRIGIFLTLVIIGGVVWGEVLSCDSCGRECAAACGTRQFRACCFNYLRKRTTPLEPIPMDPSLRLELWLARSRAVHSTPQISQTQLEVDESIQPNPMSLKDVNLIISQTQPNERKMDLTDFNNIHPII